jgi:hypothetical protein
VEQDLRYDGFDSLRMLNTRFNNFLVMTCGSTSPFSDDPHTEMFEFSTGEVRSASSIMDRVR